VEIYVWEDAIGRGGSKKGETGSYIWDCQKIEGVRNAEKGKKRENA